MWVRGSSGGAGLREPHRWVKSGLFSVLCQLQEHREHSAGVDVLCGQSDVCYEGATTRCKVKLLSGRRCHCSLLGFRASPGSSLLPSFYRVTE